MSANLFRPTKVPHLPVSTTSCHRILASFDIGVNVCAISMDIHSAKREHCQSIGGRTLMSSIEDVRSAEQRVQRILDALRKTNALDSTRLSDELKKATDEYAKAVRELKPP